MGEPGDWIRAELGNEGRILSDPIGDKAFLTPTEVADLFKVSPVTVRQWAQKGLLAAQVTAGGHRRFLPDDLRRFAVERGIELGEASGPKLLVVDDNRQFNAYLIALLQTRCPDVATASAFDGFEAGRLVQQFRPSIMLLDIMMPGLDGIEVCRALKGDPESRDIKVIGMTGHYTPELENRVLEAGASMLLRKPFSGDDVIKACDLQAASNLA